MKINYSKIKEDKINVDETTNFNDYNQINLKSIFLNSAYQKKLGEENETAFTKKHITKYFKYSRSNGGMLCGTMNPDATNVIIDISLGQRIQFLWNKTPVIQKINTVVKNILKHNLQCQYDNLSASQKNYTETQDWIEFNSNGDIDLILGNTKKLSIEEISLYINEIQKNLDEIDMAIKGYSPELKKQIQQNFEATKTSLLNIKAAFITAQSFINYKPAAIELKTDIPANIQDDNAPGLMQVEKQSLETKSNQSSSRLTKFIPQKIQKFARKHKFFSQTTSNI